VKAIKLREQSIEELRQLRNDTRQELLALKMKKGAGDSSEQPLRVRTLRREVARMETIIRERELKNNG
jgi:large subunit ribosomal protein L29